ncbi:MAG: succinylglutamate desuccinylase/aspartoacylase family protein [Mogibacterium sp.]|nr:succinylglutamate desuccinylase/aspartoacylase family protein [Mogibacterium sp.]
MIQTVVSLDFPVEEKLLIQKHRILPAGYTEDNDLSGLKRLSIVTGIHGNELEGQYVCYEVSRILREHPGCLTGIVDIYPALNPLGIDALERGVPGFDLDMNRIFPGTENGSMVEHAASRIVKDLAGSDLVLDIHASNIYLTEIPQVRISELYEATLLPYAARLNVDFIWVHAASTVLEATLAHSLNSIGTPTLVVEMGIGLRLTQAYGEQLVQGVFALLKYMGMWTGDCIEPRRPLISRNNTDVEFLNAPVAGVFLQRMEHNSYALEGQVIGEIVDPLKGECLCEVKAPCSGVIFTLRDFPIVDEGSLVGRMLRSDAIEPDLRSVYEARGTRPVSSLELEKHRGGAEE